jgi:hypothetical protein
MDPVMMIRPRGSSDIFDESAWRPSLKRYIDGQTSNERSNVDREMIAQVYKALENRDELRIVLVSTSTAMKPNTLTCAIVS